MDAGDGFCFSAVRQLVEMAFVVVPDADSGCTPARLAATARIGRSSRCTAGRGSAVMAPQRDAGLPMPTFRGARALRDPRGLDRAPTFSLAAAPGLEPKHRAA